jgi:hypothetical protein
MADFSLKAHDLLPYIEATLSTGPTPANQTPVNLTTAVGVKFIMTAKTSGTPKVEAAAQIISATGGIVRYNWIAGDTAVVGSYQAEWEVTWPGAKPQTFPKDSYHSIDIVADLNNA